MNAVPSLDYIINHPGVLHRETRREGGIVIVSITMRVWDQGEFVKRTVTAESDMNEERALRLAWDKFSGFKL